MDLTKPWDAYTFVAFDIETTGAYPLEAEICEIAAVKWSQGHIIDEFQSLVKPTQKMTDFIIGIHGITNEMVVPSPPITTVIKQFHAFLGDAIGVAHHAPFDMGFLAVAMEDVQMALPSAGALCSSLLSRSLLPEMPNHKLQTLVKELNLPGGTAHRALDDSKNCLQLFLKCIERAQVVLPAKPLTLQVLSAKQEKMMKWERFSITQLAQNPPAREVVEAIKTKKSLEVVYMSGSHKGKPREIKPAGIVRNPDGDYILAFDPLEPTAKLKRFYLNKLQSATVLL